MSFAGSGGSEGAGAVETSEVEIGETSGVDIFERIERQAFYCVDEISLWFSSGGL